MPSMEKVVIRVYMIFATLFWSRSASISSVWCQGPIIPIDIAKEDDTLESDDDVASSSEREVLSDDSAVAESVSDED